MSEDENKSNPLAVAVNNGSVERFRPTRSLPARSGPTSLSVEPGGSLDSQYQALKQERRNRFVDEDPLVKVVNHGGDTFSVLRAVKIEIARETASLHFDRIESREPHNISTKRIDALRRIADIELKIRELDQHAVNLSSEKMQRVFALWVEAMQEVAQEVMPPETVKMFFERFATAMEGWEERAQDALR